MRGGAVDQRVTAPSGILVCLPQFHGDVVNVFITQNLVFRGRVQPYLNGLNIYGFDVFAVLSLPRIFVDLDVRIIGQRLERGRVADKYRQTEERRVGKGGGGKVK